MVFNSSELELKLRAHNNLVGRLIGKGGGTIRKIMEETGCSIFVSKYRIFFTSIF